MCPGLPYNLVAGFHGLISKEGGRRERQTDREIQRESQEEAALPSMTSLHLCYIPVVETDMEFCLGSRGGKQTLSSGGEVQGSERACRTRNIAEVLLGEHNLSYSTAGVTDLFLEAICGH